METNKNIKEELENRIKQLENLIAEKGIGASALSKAKKAQRNVNLTVFFGSLITVAGVMLWILSNDNKD